MTTRRKHGPSAALFEHLEPRLLLDGGTYVIETLAELQAMSADLAGHYTLANDIDCSATSGWNGGEGFLPVGTGMTPFTGTFDGQGNALSRLFINVSDTSGTGLFGAAQGATIHDLRMTDVDITGAGTVGALAGYNLGTITNVGVTGTVTAMSEVGGLVGNNGVDGTITASFADADVLAWGGGTAGGLVGQMSSGSISNCYANGDVTVLNDQAFAGGLMGYATNPVDNCYATGNVTGYWGVGGLIGIAYDTISDSVAAGNVTGALDVGGLVGDLTWGALADCYWNNHAGNPADAYAGGNTGATAIADNEAYFYDMDVLPMSGWPTSTWSDALDDVTFPPLLWGAAGDLDFDGEVNADDIDLLRSQAGNAAYDLDGDSDTDLDDLEYLIENLVEWNDGAGGSGVGTLIGDFNLDGTVNATDLALLQASYGTTTGWANGNTNMDAVVNATDLARLQQRFGQHAPTPPVVSSVDLTPTDPDTNDDLTATVTATDPDGDNITYDYNWYKDGQLAATTVIEDGLVGYWGLNADADDYGADNDGTINGATMVTDGGIVGDAVSFDGDNDYVEIANEAEFDDLLDGHHAFSTSFWTNGSHTTGAMPVWFKGEDPSFTGVIIGDGVGGTGNHMTLEIKATHHKNINISAQNAYVEGVWQHWVISYDGSGVAAGVKMYLNGVERTLTIGFDQLAGQVVATDNNMTIGRWTGEAWGERFYEGLLDEVMLFDRIVDGDEAQMLYDGARLGGDTLAADLTTTGETWQVGVRGGDAESFGQEALSNEVVI